MTLPPFWQLDGFGVWLDAWIDDQARDDDLVNQVLDWIFTRYENPYSGVSRVPDLPNLWFGQVPGTTRGNHVVVCTYRIIEAERRVVCDGLATLRLPL